MTYLGVEPGAVIFVVPVEVTGAMVEALIHAGAERGPGQAHCQAENASGGKPFDGRGAEVPAGRRICENCTDLAGRDKADYREPNIKVLLGERLAEVEPELFASAGKPLVSSEGFPEARPVNRSKGRKPERSIAKYPRPFDDDLPW